MIDSIKLPFQFDTRKLKQDLNKVPTEEWIPHFNENDYDGKWSIAALRGPADAIHPIQKIYSNPSVTDFSDTDLLKYATYFKEVLDTIEVEKTSVRLMNLHAGSIINEHVDYNLSIEDGEARLHIPVQTNEKVEFYLNNNRIVMNEGELWYCDFTKPHRISNQSTSDRIHIVIDCIANDWLKNQVASIRP